MILTDDEIADICCEVAQSTNCDIAYARAIESAILKKIGEPTCFIPDDAVAMLAPPRIRLLDVPLITYHGENHTPLYKLPEVTK